MKSIRAILKSARIAAAIVCVSPFAAVGQGFYQGKTITVIIGGDAGISYDAYGRVLARHIGKHIPGTPSFIVQNMPGAGGSKAAEYLFSLAPRDGTTFAILFPGALIEPLIEPKRFRYDPNKFEYLGTIDQETRVCVTSAQSKMRKLEDARTTSAILAGTQPGSTTVDYPNMLNALAGTRFKVVSGYKSTNETTLAMQRGEADGMCTNLSVLTSQQPQWLQPEAGAANLIAQFGLQPHPLLTKLNVPTIWSFIAPEDRPVVEQIVTQQVFGRPFAMPPGVPPAQLDTLRQAFTATMTDKSFVDELVSMKLEINPLDGAGVSSLIKKLYSAPPELTQRVAKALKPSGS